VSPRSLSAFECEIRALVAQARSNKETAREQRRDHQDPMHNILQKLQVRGLGEAAARLRLLHTA